MDTNTLGLILGLLTRQPFLAQKSEMLKLTTDKVAARGGGGSSLFMKYEVFKQIAVFLRNRVYHL